MNERNGNRVTAGFLLAPIVPAIFLFLYGVVAVQSEEYSVWFLQTYIFVAIVVGYAVVVIIMLPTYLLFERFKITSVMVYILFGAAGGAIGYFVAWGSSLQGYIIPSLWGVLSAATFWLIARPDKNAHNKSLKNRTREELRAELNR